MSKQQTSSFQIDSKSLIQKDITLAGFTTLGIGGRAKWFCRASNLEEVCFAIEFAAQVGAPVLFLGGGSNLVISDEGFKGLVIFNQIKGRQIIREDEETATIRIKSGENWDQFVQWAVERNYCGIESLSGIPGTVGGTPIQNVGAYGQEVSDVITSVEALELPACRMKKFLQDECGFSYRKSRFNTSDKNKYFIYSVEFTLRKNSGPRITYPELKSELPPNPTIKDIRNTVINIRKRKSMVIDENDRNSRSVGSFFKNPIINSESVERIEKVVGQSPPQFPQTDRMVKIPAAWLIEKAGFNKGYRAGNVGISENHTLALVNFGGGTAEELISLAKTIRLRVSQKFGILLEAEPTLIGVTLD
jgi:UDP-N-acetylmuramate dehydrogenase